PVDFKGLGGARKKSWKIPASRRFGSIGRARSAADLRHGATRLHEARLVDLVLELLVGDCEAEQFLEVLVVCSVAERRLQVPLAAREEAGAKLPVGGQADSVARRAERLRDGVDEADLAGAVREAEPPCGRGRLGGGLPQRAQLPAQTAEPPPAS